MSTYIEKNKKTKKKIREAFIDLLEKKTFETVTVGDISKAASINRGTFYLHFEDKYDLLERIEQELFADFGTHIDQLQANYSSTISFDKEQTELAKILFQYIKNNADLLKIFLSNRGRAGFHYRFKEAFMEKVRINLIENEVYKNQLNVPIDYFLSFITSAFLGLIEQWVQNGLQKTPAEMTQYYIDIISFIQKNKTS